MSASGFGSAARFALGARCRRCVRHSIPCASGYRLSSAQLTAISQLLMVRLPCTLTRSPWPVARFNRYVPSASSPSAIVGHSVRRGSQRVVWLSRLSAISKVVTHLVVALNLFHCLQYKPSSRCRRMIRELSATTTLDNNIFVVGAFTR